MQKTLRLIITLALVFAILLAVNLGASIGLRGAKVDLTEEKLYTLSEGSRSMLSKLENNVALKLYYSRRAASNVPVINQYADRVIELLRQYEAASDGRVALEIYQPRPDTEVEEQALKYGIQPFARAGIESLYFGLAIVSELGEEQVIPFLDPARESFLEYDLSSFIAGVASPTLDKVGVMSALPVLGGPGAGDPMAALMRQQQQGSEPWALAQQLQSTYEVVEVPMETAAIPDDINVLLVIHPKGIGEAGEYAIDQFLMRGGRAIVLVDAMSEYERLHFQNPDPNARFSADFSSDLPTLLPAWGLEFDETRVLGDLDLATEVQMGPQVIRHPAWLSLGEDQTNPLEIVSSGLESLLVASAGILTQAETEQTAQEGANEGKQDEAAEYEVTELVKTKDAAGSWEAFRLKFGADPETLFRDIQPFTEPRPVAVRVAGQLESAFPDGPPAGWEAPESEADAAGHLARAEAPTSVIVIADSDMVADDFSVQKQQFFGSVMMRTLNDNLSFVNNAVDFLLGSQDLISLRTRGRSARPFTLVDELERQAQRQWADEEEMLNARLEEVNQRLGELQQGKVEGQEAVLSQQQLEQIDAFEEELATTRERLREVRRNLRQDIEALGFRIKFINIALVPLLVVLAAFIPLVWRATRMRSGR